MEVAIKEVNYNVRCVQNRKSVKFNKEKQKLMIGNLIAHHFYKILMYIYINIYIYIVFNLRTTEFNFDKKKKHK